LSARPNIGIGSQMPNRFNFPFRTQKRHSGLHIVYVQFLKMESLVVEGLGEIGPPTEQQIIHANDSMAQGEQTIDQMASDETSRAGHNGTRYYFIKHESLR
jgi:hypothetical protein